MDRREYVLASGAALSGLVGGVSVTAAAAGRSGDSDSGRASVGGQPARLQEGTGDPPEPIETRLYGTGATVTTDIRIERRGPAIFRMNYPSSGEFAVEVLDADGNQVEQIVVVTADDDSAEVVGGLGVVAVFAGAALLMVAFDPGEVA